ncbi:MAG TPA: GGDEF domain-containing protein [Xanthobacteraceae bacterium]|jgi:diguanylate cyclase (GGDEF)-like protein|nr:GGDEF domain-containing protein [Xanthobacteraceae bacterium]
MSLVAAYIYWVIVVLWLTVLGTIAFFYIRNPHTFGTTRLLLAVLAIDTFRNIFENFYFGLYFGAQYGVFSDKLVDLLGRPALLILPKAFNVLAGCIVLGLLLLRWLPLAVRERGRAEQHAIDLEMLAALDWLTGIYNRRHFETLARAELARCQRYVRPLSILMIDVDHFKAVNDRFGHATGDRVLQTIAAVCRGAKRDSDVVARMGGEEFALMLPETTEQAAFQLAERLRQQVIECAPIVDGEKVAVTVSVGIAGASLRTSGIEALMRRADQALYEAKHSGRNCVVLSGGARAESVPDAAE